MSCPFENSVYDNASSVTTYSLTSRVEAQVQSYQKFDWLFFVLI